jgi:hypothetical protein
MPNEVKLATEESYAAVVTRKFMYGILRSMLKVVIRNHILDYVVIHMSPL